MLKIIFKLFDIDWQSYRSAACFPKHCFCEHIGTGFVRQPVDAVTNLAFVLVGVYIIWYLLKKRHQYLNESIQSGISIKTLYIFGMASILVGIFSFFYHASFTFWGMELDDDSMYLIGTFMLFYSLTHIKGYRFSLKRFISIYLILNIGLELAIYFVPVIRGALFGILVLAASAFEIIAIKQKRVTKSIEYFKIALLLFFIAYLFWITDYLKIICFPPSLYQGHAIWHVLTATSVYFIFLYYKSEFRKS